VTEIELDFTYIKYLGFLRQRCTPAGVPVFMHGYLWCNPTKL